MIDDLLAFIDDAEARGLVARLIKGVLVLASYPYMAHRYAGDLLQLPADAAPIDAAHDDSKVFVVGLLVKKL